MFHVNSLLAEMPLTVALILYQVAAWGWLLKLTVTTDCFVVPSASTPLTSKVSLGFVPTAFCDSGKT